MLLPLLATSLLAAHPVKVRVLELQKPTRVTLAAKELSCDGKPLPQQVLEVRQYGQQLEAGELRCDVFKAAGDVKVTAGDVTRRYAGAVSASVASVGVSLVNELELEDYLVGVVGSELGAAPPATLEAQAIVSRTYALASKDRHPNQGYALCDYAHCQLYRGREDESETARAAVKKTAGQALLVGGVALRPAYFHAACGGATSSAADVFGEPGAGAGVKDVGEAGPWCKDAPDVSWDFTVPKLALAEQLSAQPDTPAFTALRRDPAGRALEVLLMGRRMTGGEFLTFMGKAFGWSAIRSAKVSAEEAQGQVHFKGVGLGHGVGLCQHGATALGKKGLDARKILSRYFPDRVVRVP